LKTHLEKRQYELAEQLVELNRVKKLLAVNLTEIEQLKKSIETPTKINADKNEEIEVKQTQSQMMKELLSSKLVEFRALTAKHNYYNNGKLIKSTTVNRGQKYPLEIIINLKTSAMHDLGIPNTIEIEINDLEYDHRPYFNEVFEEYYINENNIRALKYSDSEFDGYTVYSILLLNDIITIEEYHLETSLFPSNSERDEYEKMKNNLIYKNQKDKFQLISSDTYKK